MKFTIRKEESGLCSSCSFSHITVDARDTQSTICNFSRPRAINVPVVSCTEYEQKGKMSEYEAMKIGWVLELRKDRTIGFRQPKKDSDGD